MADELTGLEEFVLVLLHASASDERGGFRSWKGYDWGIMNRLHEKGMISNPVGKAKSVYLTDEGCSTAEKLELRFFGSTAARAGGEPACECGCGKPSAGGVFLPGHDQKLRGVLEQRVGGLLALRSLVDAAEAYSNGRSTTEEFAREARRIFGECSEPSNEAMDQTGR